MSGQHGRLRADQLSMECTVRVKGDDACKIFASKLLRNGIEAGEKIRSLKGRPYFEYKIGISSRAQYAKLNNIVESTEDVEFLE